MSEWTAEDSILKAKIRMQGDRPFFSYLLLRMPLRPGYTPTMGVDAKGFLYYNPEWVSTLGPECINTVLAHEVLHVALRHVTYKPENKKLANIAMDIKINDILVNSGIYDFPPNCILVPNKYHELYIREINLELTDIDKLAWQEIYELLKQKAEEMSSECSKLSTLDDHSYFGKSAAGTSDEGDTPKEGSAEGIPAEELTEKELEELAQKWKDAFVEAAEASRQRGLLPAGIGDLVTRMLTPATPWYQILYRYIQNNIVHDFTYKRPHKKSFSSGVYFPAMLRENVELVCHIDSSGSMMGEAVRQCLDQMYQVLSAFSNVTADLIIGDTQLQQEFKLTRKDRYKLDNFPIKGYRGTSHKFVADWLQTNRPNCKILISLTDGYSDIEQVFPIIPHTCKKILVIPGDVHGNSLLSERLKQYAQVIKIRN